MNATIMSSNATEYSKGDDNKTERSMSVSSSKSTLPLVELSLKDVTYAPVTRRAASGKGGAGNGAGNGGSKVTSNASQNSNNGLKSRKMVLQNVSATISPYKLSAWMGPSGSGKTSLITVAAGLVANAKEDLIDNTCIRVNGEDGILPKRLVGVVWQDDLLLPNLTVLETVRFAARLKTSEKESTIEEIHVMVDQTLERLGLDHIKDSLIGVVGGTGSSRGISGGERKRVAVATELVGKPSILLLDEPTSGLDSTSAQALISTLKDLATSGHAIAAVIHQPRTAIFEHFDHLLLLSRGRMVYSGHPMSARQALESCPSVQCLPEQTGIADWIMDVISADEMREGGSLLPTHWQDLVKNNAIEEGGETSDAQQQQQKRPTKFRWSRGNKQLSTLAELNAQPKFFTSFWTQLRLLTTRAMKQQRGEKLTAVSIYLTITYIVFTSYFWFRLEDNTDRVFERISLMFFNIIAQSNSIVTASMTTFSRERALLSRERAKKMYGVLPYFLAKTASDMTNSVFLPMCYGFVIYWLTNLRPTVDAFLFFLLVFYMTVSTAQSTGLFLSVAIPNFEIALKLGPLLTLLLMILGGFYIPLNNMHAGVSWVTWLSMARYGFSAFLVNEFRGRFIPCQGDSVSVSIGSQSDECPLPGDAVIESLGISGVSANKWFNVGMLFAMQVVLRVSAYALLRRSK